MIVVGLFVFAYAIITYSIPYQCGFESKNLMLFMVLVILPLVIIWRLCNFCMRLTIILSLPDIWHSFRFNCENGNENLIVI